MPALGATISYPAHSAEDRQSAAPWSGASARVAAERDLVVAQLPASPPRGPVEGKPFVVDGIALGSRLNFDSQTYRDYQCEPSEQFEKYTVCRKVQNEKEKRGAFKSYHSLLQSPDGIAVYINRFQEPAFFDANEAQDDIDRYSRSHGQAPKIFRMPTTAGLPTAIIAAWGKVQLEPLGTEDLKLLADNKEIRRGYLIDFLGNFARSAREGMPVYRLSGGAGFVWAANYDENGRGTLRFAAVDASAFAADSSTHPPPPPPVAQSAPPAQGAPPALNAPPARSAQTASAAQPIAVLGKPFIDFERLKLDQLARDALFQQLKAESTKYTFDYVVMTLPPGALPGVDVPIPVSHVRFNSTVFFAFDSYALLQNAEAPILDLAKTILKDKTIRSVLIVGHTDAKGTHEYNENLSLKRAAAVATRLRLAGVKDEFLGVVPMGDSQPVAPNNTDEGRAINRRVEFFISEVPEASKKVVEMIKFNPCFRSTNEAGQNSDCTSSSKPVPIYSGSTGQGLPSGEIDLTRSALPYSPDERIRDALPNEIPERPPLRELQGK
jgi:outer membrane protein OmpA-like peptidoglycan-associated protein